MGEWRQVDDRLKKIHHIQDYPETSNLFYVAEGWGEDEYTLIGFCFDTDKNLLKFRFTTDYDPYETTFPRDENYDFDPFQASGFIHLTEQQTIELLQLLVDQAKLFGNVNSQPIAAFEKIPVEKLANYGIVSNIHHPSGEYFIYNPTILTEVDRKRNLINIDESLKHLTLSTTQLPENLENPYHYYHERSIGLIDFTYHSLLEFCELLRQQLNKMEK